MYIYPPLIFFLMGTRRGVITILIMAVILVLYFLVIGIPEYFLLLPIELIQRLIATVFALSLLSFFLEQFREKRHAELLGLSRELEYLARTDSLSGLFNRLSMGEIINREFPRYKRSKLAFSVIMCDIDHFKQVNDTAGHQAGDLVIQEISRVINNSLREQDAAARWGGEEFLVFLPSTALEGAVITAERLRSEIENLRINDDISVTLSFGVAMVQGDENFDTLLSRADDNLYKAKNTGRNNVVY
jgi:diguanylate cyclase (GGDEF)-like protein